VTHPPSYVAAAQRLVAYRAKQGLPAKITDPVVLAKIAQIVQTYRTEQAKAA
jgi:hypothetical protein